MDDRYQDYIEAELYDLQLEQWAKDRARAEAEWEKHVSGWVEPREEEDDVAADD